MDELGSVGFDIDTVHADAIVNCDAVGCYAITTTKDPATWITDHSEESGHLVFIVKQTSHTMTKIDLRAYAKEMS